jgi:hypothetical protein
MFGRNGERRHQPVVFGIFDQQFLQKLGGSLHHRVILPEKISVAGERKVFPQVLAQPRAAGGPHAVSGGVHRRRAAPEIGVVMDHPAAAVVVSLGSPGASLG